MLSNLEECSQTHTGIDQVLSEIADSEFAQCEGYHMWRFEDY